MISTHRSIATPFCRDDCRQCRRHCSNPPPIIRVTSRMSLSARLQRRTTDSRLPDVKLSPRTDVAPSHRRYVGVLQQPEDCWTSFLSIVFRTVEARCAVENRPATA